MATTFDPYDRTSWYFGQMSRLDATDLLMAEKEGGVFLVRDSISKHGDYVLCVREDSKVSHYIINKILENDQIKYRIGDQTFSDLPELIAFYKLHYLDTTPLIRPAPRKNKDEKVIAKYDFEGNDQDDLPFRKGDILTVVSRDEEGWWTARNNLGQIGSIPVPYVQKYEGQPVVGSNPPVVSRDSHSPTSRQSEPARRTNTQRKLPAYAIVKQARIPNAYDKTALKLEVGKTIKVTKMNINGQWEGEFNGKIGHFPFTHVEFIDTDSNELLEES